MAFVQCEFIRTNGKRCGSPALRGKSICYHHLFNNRRSVLPGQPGYRLPMLEDKEAIQVAITQLMRSVLLGYIDQKRARTLLNALQLAVRNISGTNFNPYFKDVVTDLTEAMEIFNELKKPPAPTQPEEPLALLEEKTTAADR